MNSPKISIPEQALPGLMAIAHAEDEAISRFISGLRDSSPSIDVEDIAASISKEADVEFSFAVDVLRATTSMYFLRDSSHFGTEEIAQIIAAELQRQLEDNEESLNLSNEEIALFQKRLSLLLEVGGSIETSLKASNLLADYENIYVQGRILTDIRPVFKTEIKDGMGGALIVHNLRIGYVNLGSKGEFFVALDLNDLYELIEQLGRALDKENALKSLLDKAEISVLNASPSLDEDSDFDEEEETV